MTDQIDLETEIEWERNELKRLRKLLQELHTSAYDNGEGMQITYQMFDRIEEELS